MKIFRVLLIFLLFISSELHAQQDTAFKKSIIKIAPGALAYNKFRVSYERLGHSKLSWGMMLTLQYGGSLFLRNYAIQFSGILIEPYARYYFGKNSGTGFYLQGRARAGLFSGIYLPEQAIYYNPAGQPVDTINNNYYYPLSTRITSGLRTPKFFTFGAGADLGYQCFIGKPKRLCLDVNVGLQYASFNENVFDKEEGHKDTFYDHSSAIYQYRGGSSMRTSWTSGSIGYFIHGMVSLGYKF